jgi:biopolymer transport protein ExbB/TolQ
MSHSLARDIQYRVTVALGALVIGAAFVGLFSLLLPLPVPTKPDEVTLSGLLLGRLPPGAIGYELYPLTIQNLQWLVFFLGLGELWVRLGAGRAEAMQLAAGLLPEDDESMLRVKDLAPIYSRISAHAASRQFNLQRLIRRVALQFQSSRSVDQANSILNSSLELMQHEIDLRYNMLRYIVWLIPTLGFIGTVIGIAFSLAGAANMPPIQDSEKVQEWVRALTVNLGVAFNTTFVALLLAAILVFVMHIAQAREEQALNSAGQYCLDNLIIRLYEE